MRDENKAMLDCLEEKDLLDLLGGGEIHEEIKPTLSKCWFSCLSSCSSSCRPSCKNGRKNGTETGHLECI